MQARPPIVTVGVATNPVPLIVTAVEPAVEPLTGEIDPIVGEEIGVLAQTAGS